MTYTIIQKLLATISVTHGAQSKALCLNGVGKRQEAGVACNERLDVAGETKATHEEALSPALQQIQSPHRSQ